jgi:hypothetical protein
VGNVLWNGPDTEIPTTASNEITGTLVGGYSSICSKKGKDWLLAMPCPFRETSKLMCYLKLTDCWRKIFDFGSKNVLSVETGPKYIGLNAIGEL